MLARFWMILTVVMLLTTPVIGDEIKIASWNIQQFGKAKAFGENHEQNNTLGKIANIIKKGKYDLIVIQEVQDKKRRALPKLLKTLGAGWEYVESERTGPGTKKEQYAIFFKCRKLRPKDPIDPLMPRYTIHLYRDIEMERLPEFGMKRLPGYCSFETTDGSFDFTIITFHNRTWEKGACEDADFLDDIHDGVQKELGAEDNDILLLGDFNIEAEYEKHFNELTDIGIKNAIPFGTDTMVSENDSTLDNIFYLKCKDLTLKRSDSLEFDDHDEFGKGYDKRISDHYPVWATFEIPKVDNDK